MLVKNIRLRFPFLACLLWCVIPLNTVVAENRSPHWLRANQLMDLTVENIDGERIGNLRNIAIDLRSGKVRYVILSPKGIFAARTRLRAVPPDLIFAATAKRNVLGLALTQAEWERTPVFTASEIDDLEKPEYRQRIEQFYQKWNSTVGEGGHAQAEEIQLANDIIGKTIVNREQVKLGDILDLLVLLDKDSPALAVFSAGRMFPDGKHAFAVPLRALRQENNRLVLDADRKSLRAARPFDREARKTIRRAGTPHVFSYVLKE